MGDVNGAVDVFGLACSADAAAKGVLPKANALSIKHNREFGGLIYESEGKYLATPPIPRGKKSFKPSSARPHVPENANVVGDYHTHGEYSRDVIGRNGKIKTVRTNKGLDELNSDNFSRADIIAHSNSPSGHSTYLGTPSGVFKKLHNGTQSIL